MASVLGLIIAGLLIFILVKNIVEIVKTIKRKNADKNNNNKEVKEE